MQQQYDNNARLDRMLDAAIASYADPAEAPQPRQFAAKIMAAAQESAPRRSRWLWPLAIGIPALAAMAIAAVLLLKAPVTPQVARIPKPSNVIASRIPQVAVVSIMHPKKRTQHIEVAERILPKLDQFPSPRPPTEEEMALASFAHRSTLREKEAALRAQQQTVEPLEIAEIHIQPLDSEEKNEPSEKN